MCLSCDNLIKFKSSFFLWISQSTQLFSWTFYNSIFSFPFFFSFFLTVSVFRWFWTLIRYSCTILFKKKTLFLTRSMSLVRSYTFKSSMSQIEGAKQSALLFIVSSLRHLNINKKEKSKKLSVFCFLRLLPSMNKRKINNWKKEKKSTFLL